MFSIISGLLMFMLLVLIHEFGHFAVAKLSGIKVNEFSIGMGPNVANFVKGETKYSIRALPLGGFVSMEGEDEQSSDPRSFSNAKASSRFFTILAGPVMNLLLAFVIFIGIFAYTGSPNTTIGSILDGSPAKEAGLQVGDKILSIDDKKISSFTYVSKYINESENEAVKVSVLRSGEEKLFEIKPVIENQAKRIGFSPEVSKDFGFIVKESFSRVFFIIGMLWQTIVQLFTGLLGLNAVGGPIEVIRQAGQASSAGLLTALNFLALISINLGFFNLLPIPALDGSKLLFIMIEKIIGRPINQKFEQTITIAGFIFLMGLILIVSIKDVFSLFR